MTDPQHIPAPHGPPVQRQIWRGHLLDDCDPTADVESLQSQCQTLVEAGHLLTASLFRWEQRLFLYLEVLTDGAPVSGISGPSTASGVSRIEQLTAALRPALASWPGETTDRHWVAMTDIFHYHRCLGAEQWRRKTPPERRSARVLRVRPEMASSYIFLHYQLQEERPAVGDKYGIIALHEDLMFFYAEDPAVIESPLYEGQLDTQNTPGDWHTLMEPHFSPWNDDGEEPFWRAIDCLFAV
ncbi:MAG: hypothetical protein HN712_04485 [Gemmatimonadetes bacterium]|jgi:hypothetical protein|nr:hypothetical protein [Gemmatimonadota bacterium]MBT6146447.1 hypothetical protein [Gemmatimonadota bacterium]MBT7859542.1 hypothetical protein [Gemmatimonadota bacterium]